MNCVPFRTKKVTTIYEFQALLDMQQVKQFRTQFRPNTHLEYKTRLQPILFFRLHTNKRIIGLTGLFAFTWFRKGPRVCKVDFNFSYQQNCLEKKVDGQSFHTIGRLSKCRAHGVILIVAFCFLFY